MLEGGAQWQWFEVPAYRSQLITGYVCMSLNTCMREFVSLLADSHLCSQHP